MKSLEKQISSTFIPKKRAPRNPAHLLATLAVDAMLEKKAHDVTVMDMRRVSGVADYFVICTGDSDLQIKAIADEIDRRIREACKERPWHTEGTDHWQWVLIDYVDVVAHVFSRERRAYYDLERLWGDAPREHVPEEAAASDVQILREAATHAGTREAGGKR